MKYSGFNRQSVSNAKAARFIGLYRRIRDYLGKRPAIDPNLDHATAVRKYRVDERRHKADRKQLEAARRRFLARKK